MSSGTPKSLKESRPKGGENGCRIVTIRDASLQSKCLSLPEPQRKIYRTGLVV